jgi:hypothetical protein
MSTFPSASFKVIFWESTLTASALSILSAAFPFQPWCGSQHDLGGAVGFVCLARLRARTSRRARHLGAAGEQEEFRLTFA